MATQKEKTRERKNKINRIFITIFLLFWVVVFVWCRISSHCIKVQWARTTPPWVFTLHHKLNSSTSKTHSHSMMKMSFWKMDRREAAHRRSSTPEEGAESERECERVPRNLHTQSFTHLSNALFAMKNRNGRTTRFIKMLNAFPSQRFPNTFLVCRCVQSHNKENKNEMHEDGSRRTRKTNVLSWTQTYHSRR